MFKAISNTSPFLYLYRIGILEWLPRLIQEIWIPPAVSIELAEGQRKGYDVPSPGNYHWIQIVSPRSLPSEWLALDLGAGELSAMALTLENPDRIVLLDDMLARRTAQAAGLKVWGTLRILLESKNQGFTNQIAPLLANLNDIGMWISDELRQRILKLAGESSQ